jgi:hypothetical protein
VREKRRGRGKKGGNSAASQLPSDLAQRLAAAAAATQAWADRFALSCQPTAPTPADPAWQLSLESRLVGRGVALANDWWRGGEGDQPSASAVTALRAWLLAAVDGGLSQLLQVAPTATTGSFRIRLALAATDPASLLITTAAIAGLWYTPGFEAWRNPHGGWTVDLTWVPLWIQPATDSNEPLPGDALSAWPLDGPPLLPAAPLPDDDRIHWRPPALSLTDNGVRWLAAPVAAAEPADPAQAASDDPPPASPPWLFAGEWHQAGIRYVIVRRTTDGRIFQGMAGECPPDMGACIAGRDPLSGRWLLLPAGADQPLELIASDGANLAAHLPDAAAAEVAP